MKIMKGLVAIGVMVLGGATLLAQTIQINGAGATFPYPIYSKWFAEYNKLHPSRSTISQSVQVGGSGRSPTAQSFLVPRTVP